MPDSRRFLHPEAIKRIARLDLRARQIVEGFLAGMHRSPSFGQSVEFLQHRQYTAGDDPRYVDWKVWAKQDRLYVKRFEEDTNLRCTLLVDVSASMRYGSAAMDKYEYGCTVAASLALLVLRQQDAVGCVAFDEQADRRPPADAAEPPGVDSPGARRLRARQQDRPLSRAPQGGGDLPAAWDDGPRLGPAGRPAAAVSRAAAAPQAGA